MYEKVLTLFGKVNHQKMFRGIQTNLSLTDRQKKKERKGQDTIWLFATNDNNYKII